MKLPRSQHGATYIEAIGAVAVFSLVAIGLSPGLISARKYAALSSNQSIATALAQDMLEQVRARGSAACANDTSGIFTRACTFTSNIPVAGVSRAAVTVSWRDRPDASSVTLVALFK